ncbi:hypothetical protein RJ639_007503 [Escallonia herrerae]|uniref:Uncharacterized protein n=1 Tax=Escallonia herrerae TaxID=1293975 RepID=A0AA88VUF3_9ASTE|nr:hypothetical protein RJ639_007503 [Escallonia herrerae]
MQPTFFFILTVQVCTLVTCSGESITKFPAILIFGDSTVDTGNNNYILTIAQGNHRPYGQDFPGHIPTGRFSNGKLVPDFLASALGIKEAVPPFLLPDLSDDELRTGVSFASGGAGFDDLTGAAFGIIPVSKQPRYLESYIERLWRIVGEEEAQRIVSGALVVVTAGTNDLIYNFYDIPTRKPFFTIEAYQEFLQDKIQNFTKVFWKLGEGAVGLDWWKQDPCLNKAAPRSGTLHALPFRNRNHMDKEDVLDLIHMLLKGVQVCNLVTCSSESTTKFPAILIFGDSTVDTGNNNYIPTIAKGNHRPYGLDFPGHIPTGRFSNGKLVPDFLVSVLGIKEAVPPFLQPNLSDDELRTGVSFASGGAGFDDLTSAVIGIIPVSKQLRYLESYIERLRGAVGEGEAQRIVNGALGVVSAGTNDLIFNFYDIPTRKPFFTIEAYQDFLQDKIQNFTKDLYNLGCRTIVVSGLPPIGCLPIQMTTKSIIRNCVRSQNYDSQLYNDKLMKVLPRLQASLPRSRILYADIYTPLMDMINNPGKYGFLETGRGCCGTGLVEAGPL